MDLFERLGHEHEIIASVAAALDAFVDGIASDTSETLHECIRFVTFLRGFADGMHHEREESVVLATLGTLGLSLEVGPLGHIRDQHREEARLLLELEKASSAPGPWTGAAAVNIATAAHALTTFERAHMAKERELLWPFAQRELASRGEQLGAAAARFERAVSRRWDVPWLETLAHELVAAHPPR